MKFITIEMQVTNETDIYDANAQSGLVDAVKTFEAVLDARVVGTGEGPDPQPEPTDDPVT